jgi:hypothetical protein
VLRDWWLVILTCFMLAAGLGGVLGFQLIELESARWALSALVQGGGALLGIFFVALGLLWGQANREEERLKELQPSYMDVLAPQSKALLAVRQALINAANDSAFQSSEERMNSLRDCYWRLAALSYASVLYRGGTLLPDELLPHASDFDLSVDDETERRLRTTAFELSFDESGFFRYLLDLGNRLSLLRRYLSLAGEQELFADSMRRAQREDRVGISLQRIQFFRYFGGNSLKAISVMWLICLTFGLLMLVALDRIPEHSLPYLVSIPIAIGVMAIGITLSLGLRALRSRE